jgi:hypothetical protein
LVDLVSPITTNIENSSNIKHETDKTSTLTVKFSSSSSLSLSIEPTVTSAFDSTTIDSMLPITLAETKQCMDQNMAVESIKKLSNSEANHLFTALRKAANHPLLLRVHYRDPVVLRRIANVCFARGHFGTTCTVERVLEELENMSDFDVHQICVEYGDAIGKFELDESVLYDSPKMMKLKVLLPELQV